MQIAKIELANLKNINLEITNDAGNIALTKNDDCCWCVWTVTNEGYTYLSEIKILVYCSLEYIVKFNEFGDIIEICDYLRPDYTLSKFSYELNVPDTLVQPTNSTASKWPCSLVFESTSCESGYQYHVSYGTLEFKGKA